MNGFGERSVGRLVAAHYLERLGGPIKIGIDNALGIHPEALRLRAKRAELIANNIANADTPGFKARDIDFQSVLASRTGDRFSTSGVRRTDEQHMSLQNLQSTNGTHATLYRTALMPSLDGNSVDVQMEQTAFAQNSIQYLASLRFLNGRIQGMMSAIKGE